MLLHFVTSLNSNFQIETHFDLNPSIFPSFVSTMTLHFTSSTENAKTSKMINEFILPSVLLFCAAIPNKKLGNVKQNGKIKKISKTLRNLFCVATLYLMSEKQ